MRVMAMEPTRHVFTVAEFEQMGVAGVFDPEARLELIDGEIIEMTPIGIAHARCVTNLNNLLIRAFGDRAMLSPQNPVHLSDVSMPQPDLVVIPTDAWDHMPGHITPADIALLIEVSDSTLAFDRRRKLPLYARAGVGEVWIVDVKSQTVEAYRRPAGEGYETTERRSAGETLDVAVLPGSSIAVDDMFR